jgi:hypothetical protein
VLNFRGCWRHFSFVLPLLTEAVVCPQAQGCH